MISPFWWVAAVALVVAALATLADMRRHRRQRRSLDDIGIMPWRGISIAAFFAAMIAAMLAFHNY